MNKLNNRLIQALFFSISVLSISVFLSCEKDPDQLGSDLFPIDDNFVLKSDTSSVIIATTVPRGPIITHSFDYGAVINKLNILGDFNDSIFGNTKAAFLANFGIDTANYGNSPKVDSLIFYLHYDSILGNPNNLKINIYKLKDTISIYSTYYSNISSERYKGSPISSNTLKFSNDTLKIQITDQQFSDSLLLALASIKDSISYEKFKMHFKGFYIEAEAIGDLGALVISDPLAASSKMVLTYINGQDTSKRNYYMNKGARISNFAHNYTATIESAVQIKELDSKITYVHGMAGVATQIHIQDLERFIDLVPVSINKAELTIPINTKVMGTWQKTIPQQLFLMAVSDDDKFYDLEYGLGYSFIKGEYDSDKKAYVFNLAKHLQQIANSKFSYLKVKNTDLVIVADGYSIFKYPSVSGVALDFSPTSKVKLNITYSKQ